jgi:hypothetical protein
VSMASFSMGSLSRAGKSVLAVWVMVNLPRCATCVPGRGHWFL